MEALDVDALQRRQRSTRREITPIMGVNTILLLHLLLLRGGLSLFLIFFSFLKLFFVFSIFYFFILGIFLIPLAVGSIICVEMNEQALSVEGCL